MVVVVCHNYYIVVFKVCMYMVFPLWRCLSQTRDVWSSMVSLFLITGGLALPKAKNKASLERDAPSGRFRVMIITIL